MRVALPKDLSTWVEVRKVEQRFGLLGFARFVKIMELLAASPLGAASRIELPVSDWQEVLGCKRDELREFLAFLQRAEWLSVEEPADHGLPLCVTLLHPARLQGIDGPQLFETPEQWAAWWSVEMGMPPALANDPSRLQVFAYWCAVNVTVAELLQAVEAATSKNASVDPYALNSEIRALREARIRQARN